MFKKGMLSLTIATILLTGCQPATPEESLQAAQEAMSKQNYQEAVVVLKNAAQDAPLNMEIREALGQALYHRRDLAAAAKELTTVIEDTSYQHEPISEDMLFASLYFSNRAEDLVLLEENLGDKASDKIRLFADIGALVVNPDVQNQSNVIEGNSRAEKVLRTFQLIRAGDFSGALKLSNVVVESDMAVLDTVLHFTHARLLARENSFAEALTHLQPVYEEFRNIAVVAMFNAELLVNMGELEKAEKITQAWLEEKPKMPLLNQIQADIDMQQGEFDSAIRHAEIAAQSPSASVKTNIIAGLAALKVSSWEKAYTYLTRAHNQAPEYAKVKRLLARVQLELGYFEEATAVLQSLEMQSEEDSAFLISASDYLFKHGNHDEAKQVLESSLGRAENDQAILLQLSSLQMSSSDEAVEETIKRMLASDSESIGAKFLQIQRHVKAGDYAAAKEVVKTFDNQEGATPNVLRAMIAMGEQQHETALQYTSKVLEQDPENMSALRIAMIANYQLGNHAETLDQSERLLLLQPFSWITVTDYLKLLEDEKVNVGEVLKRKQKEAPDAVGFRLANAVFYFRNNNYKEAASQLEPQEGELPPLFRKLLISSYLEQGNYGKAEEVAKRWLEKSEGNNEAALTLIGIQELAGNIEKATSLAEKYAKQFPADLRFDVSQFYLLMRQGEFEKAESLLVELRRSTIPSGLLSQFEGELAMADRNIDSAIKHFESALKNSQNFGTAVMLARGYGLKGDIEKGLEVLEATAAGTEQNDPKLQHAIAQYSMTFGVPKKAVQIYKNIIETNSEDAHAHNNLAVALYELGSLDEALEHVNTAISLQTSEYYFDTKGLILNEKENYSGAEENFRKALKVNPNYSEAALHLSQVLVKQGMDKEARQLHKDFHQKAKSKKERDQWRELEKQI
ncbi:tetratricopeptide repeat protein [Alteromonas sp. ASW11-19]|uniref:Tetratricopeptide repeat protein n=1 Tax=Alteromonas salexigens TaxID=2982530 RepID=A0ABT2VQN9_9ALTE|nr:tetratricopeptide repeat protein [Alteromonas salexigens]MCU7555637.1 tetratricopeptide repeat protein [Alteromonas salexigens]